ncbi:Clp protease N-terminal domain-containing protein [Streptomyces sp. NPDC050617]|uniref:Clp protease N-terminal domain-containing protein n=1 Tax=Streptomyces sp. NPDC050617 TaxID=3154628 RepID=UPI00343B5140
MQSRIPSTDPTGDGHGGQLSVEMASVVASARRRATRDGDAQIDTAHLLHALLESAPGARDAFDGGPPQIARLLGYLVQRTIGYGLRWYGSVEDSGALPVLDGGAAPGWSPSAAAAMDTAAGRAHARGADLATGVDLLAALAHDRECRAVEVLHRAGVDLDALTKRLLDDAACQEPT